MAIPTRQQIFKAKYTKAQLEQWGISWPPPKGWRKELLELALEQEIQNPLQTEHKADHRKEFFDWG